MAQRRAARPHVWGRVPADDEGCAVVFPDFGTPGDGDGRGRLDPGEPDDSELLAYKAEACRAVFCREFEHCTVIGMPQDLDAVELLLASLLAQAEIVHARHVSPTVPFWNRPNRRSFLVTAGAELGSIARTDPAVAVECGELVRAALARVADEVDATFERLLPHRARRTPKDRNRPEPVRVVELGAVHLETPDRT